MGSNVSITKEFKWEMGHRILGHEGKCAHAHGHSYICEITVTGPASHTQLDTLGRVVDFSVVKEVIGAWIDDNWDHAMLLCDKDPLAVILKSTPVSTAQGTVSPRVFLVPWNPTAENMARFLLSKFAPAMSERGLVLSSVVVWETATAKATATPTA